MSTCERWRLRWGVARRHLVRHARPRRARERRHGGTRPRGGATDGGGEALFRYGPSALAVDALAEALLPSLRTPLGPLADGRTLAGIAPNDRLAELDFELPLRGGDRPNGTTRLSDLAALLRAHLPADDPLAGYADLLDDPVVGEAPARLPGRQHRRRAPGRRPLRRRRLQDQPPRCLRRAADRVALPPRRDGRGHDARPLPAAGAAVRRGAAPFPALAAARLRPGRSPRRRALPVPARHVRARRPSLRRDGARRLRLAPAHRARPRSVPRTR